MACMHCFVDNLCFAIYNKNRRTMIGYEHIFEPSMLAITTTKRELTLLLVLFCILVYINKLELSK